ncbi:MAG: zinc ribbon domain-containing protein [Anaerolineae bacterium]|nr:zinc ribbon domain-containing protein [Anaerolineae bacterium]
MVAGPAGLASGPPVGQRSRRSVITCPYCHTSNRDGSNFCNECGRPLNRAVAPPLVSDEGAGLPAPPRPPLATARPSAPSPQRAPSTPLPSTASSGCSGCELVLLASLVGLVTLGISIHGRGIHPTRRVLRRTL